MQTREQQVKAGAELLDRKGPDNWFWRVNTDMLDISSEHNCVLGQCYRSNALEPAYDIGKRALGVANGEEYGFVGMTTPLWIKEIEARRDASLKSVQEDGRVEFAGLESG